ncbi:MAG: hypothetical protein K8T10_18970 [Candidatus Eremiobacteraeota bacterium]|nr:hypothetical protein [Candidatus Eremiobacteraeota bacterium]
MSKESRAILNIGIIFIILSAFFFAGCGGSSGGGGDATPTPTNTGWVSQETGTTNDLNDVFFVNTGSGLMVGNIGTILKTSDGGTSWSSRDSGVSSNLKGLHFSDADSGVIVGDSGVILTTSDGGETWGEKNTGLFRQTSSGLNDVFTVGSSIWIVGDSGSILHSPDAGVTWTSQTSGTSSNLYSIQFADSTTGWIVGDSGVILHTTDAGVTWAQQVSGVNGALHGVFFIDSFNGWACGAGGILIHTADGGATWTTQTSPTEENLYNIYFVDSTNGWAVGANGTIIHTTTGKGNWANQNSGISNNLNGVHFTDRNNGHSSGSGGSALGTTSGGEPTPTPTVSPTSSPTTSPSPTPSPTVPPSPSPTTSPSPTPSPTTTPGPGPGEKKWQGSVVIDGGADEFAGEQQVAVGTDGTAIAVFMQIDDSQGILNARNGGRDVVYARKWNGSGWEIIKQIDDIAEGDSANPNVAFDSQGNAICVFVQTDGVKRVAGRYKLFARKLDKGSANWGASVIIDDPAQGSSGLPEIKFAPDGTALCVFAQTVGANERIYANYYNGTNWGVAGIIDSGADQGAVNPKVAIDNNGNGICVFVQSDGVRDRIYARKWDGNTKDWGNLNTIDLDGVNAGDAEGIVDVAFSPNGDAIAVFDQVQKNIPVVGDISRAFANNCQAGAWQGAVPLSQDPTGSAMPAIATANDGSALAVFVKQDDGVGHERIFANRWDGAAWGTPEAIDDPTENFSNSPDIAFDSRGNAFCIFTQFTDAFAFRTFVSKWNYTHWSSPVAIDSACIGLAISPPHIAFDSNGNAVAVFNEYPDIMTPRVYANVYR